MGGQIVEVELYEDGDVKGDGGGDDRATRDHFSCPGDDAPPLPGDDAAAMDVPGAGAAVMVAYADETEKAAAPGEKRIYARAPDGSVVAEFHLKGDGSWTISNLLAPVGGVMSCAADGTITINGVDFSPTGDVSTAGEVSAGIIPIPLSTHVHGGVLTGGGVSGPPQGPP